MPQKFENLPPNWDNIDDECQHIALNCPWTLTSNNESFTIIITCLKWTYNYNFWIRVTAHPQEDPKTSKQINIDEHHPLLKSLSEALYKYDEFPELHLNSHELYIFGELLDYFDFIDL